MFHQRPKDVAKWTTSELILASTETEGQLPMERWLPFFASMLCTISIRGKIKPDRFLKDWGFVFNEPKATEEQLLGWFKTVSEMQKKNKDLDKDLKEGDSNGRSKN